jgi:hypothetical protein
MNSDKFAICVKKNTNVFKSLTLARLAEEYSCKLIFSSPFAARILREIIYSYENCELEMWCNCACLADSRSFFVMQATTATPSSTQQGATAYAILPQEFCAAIQMLHS